MNSSQCSRLLFNYVGRTARYVSTSAPPTYYKSAVSLDKIYPSSDLDLTRVLEPPKTEGLNFSGYVPMDKVQVTYSRSSGPGGQNVNKINTKVDLRFHLDSADWLSPQLKEILATKYKTSITVEGCLLVRSDRTRSQQLNLADVMDKLRHMIHTAAYIPQPPSSQVLERNRRRHEAAVRERLRQKRERSLTKQSRQEPEYNL